MRFYGFLLLVGLLLVVIISMPTVQNDITRGYNEIMQAFSR